MGFLPNAAQREAIEHPPAPLLLLAGAGSGKTSTLIARIVRFIQTGIARPEEIVILTFTERAALELEDKVIKEIPGSFERPTAATFHAFCNRIVQEFAPPGENNPYLMTEGEPAYLLIRRLEQLSLNSSEFRLDPRSAALRAMIPFFDRLGDELLSPVVVERLLTDLRLTSDNIMSQFPHLSNEVTPEEATLQLGDLVRAAREFDGWKRSLGALDYGDMVLGCWRLLTSDAARTTSIRGRYRHFFVDEFQDNNAALNQVLALLVGEQASLTVVGDEDQCIYSFRGANYFNVRDFRRRYKGQPGYRVIKLESNYRSTIQILNLANGVMANDSFRTPKQLLEAPDTTHGSTPVLHVVDSTKQMLEGMTELVRSLVLEKGLEFRDIAVLCRTRSHVTAAARCLEEAAVPVDMFVEEFFSIPVVRDVLAWCHLLCRTARGELALFRILSVHVSIDFARRFFSARPRLDLQGRLAELQEQSNASLPTQWSESLAFILKSLEGLEGELRQKRNADEMVWEVLNKADLLADQRHSYRFSDRLALRNAGHLLTLAARFTRSRSDHPLREWLAYMDTLQLIGDTPAKEPAMARGGTGIHVMTIHRAKGLQFPVVIIPFLQAGSFPTRRSTSPMVDRLPEEWYSWERPDHLTAEVEHVLEERRIFYVAVTRAERELHLFAPVRKRSRLVQELVRTNPNCLEEHPVNETRVTESTATPSKSRDYLLASLSRELASCNYAVAEQILGKLKEVESEPPVKKATTERVTSERLTLSATDVEDYQKCSWHYRLNRIDKISEWESRAQLEFGIIIHKVLQEFHGLSKDQTLSTLLSLLDIHWKPDAFEYPSRGEEFHKQGAKILTDYHAFFLAHPAKVLAREIQFRFEDEESNLVVRGKIDRIDHDETTGGVLLVDYKTSRDKNPKAKESLQLALYALAVEKGAVKDIPRQPATTALHFLRSEEDPIDSHAFTKEELAGTMESVREVAEGIRSQSFAPNRGWHCTWCNYKDFLCPAWEGERKSVS